jgi:hypothetical protein
MMCRKRIDDVKTGGMSLTRDESGGWPDCRPDGIRHEGGVTPHLAFAWNVGTCRLDAKGDIQMGSPHEDQSTEARHRDGATRSVRWAAPRSGGLKSLRRSDEGRCIQKRG